jgi:hypothetical protein
VKKRYKDRRTAEIMSLIKTMVIGLNVSLATLNQINENDQKIIARITALYTFTLLLNGFS